MSNLPAVAKATAAAPSHTEGTTKGLSQTLSGALRTTFTGSVAVTGTFWQATQPVSLASVPSHAVTNAGTFAVQASGADGANVTLGTTTGAAVSTDANGTLQQYLRGLIKFFANALGAGTAAAAHRMTLASDDPAVTLMTTIAAAVGSLSRSGGPTLPSTFSVTQTTYAVNRCIGPLITLSGLPVSTFLFVSFRLRMLNLNVSTSNNLTGLFFTDNPTASTFGDNVALVINKADYLKTFATNAAATLPGTTFGWPIQWTFTSQKIKTNSSGQLFFQCVQQLATPSFTTTAGDDAIFYPSFDWVY